MDEQTTEPGFTCKPPEKQSSPNLQMPQDSTRQVNEEEQLTKNLNAATPGGEISLKDIYEMVEKKFATNDKILQKLQDSMRWVEVNMVLNDPPINLYNHEYISMQKGSSAKNTVVRKHAHVQHTEGKKKGKGMPQVGKNDKGKGVKVKKEPQDEDQHYISKLLRKTDYVFELSPSSDDLEVIEKMTPMYDPSSVSSKGEESKSKSVLAASTCTKKETGQLKTSQKKVVKSVKGKKLTFESPKSTPAVKKRGRGNTSKMTTQTKKVAQQTDGIMIKTTPSLSRKPNVVKCDGMTTPGYVECKFKCTQEMDLNKEDFVLATYIFHNGFDESEILMKNGEAYLQRWHFECLVPGQTITGQIIHLLAMKNTWTQNYQGLVRTWCMTPSFADDIIRGDTVDALYARYANPWMPSSSDLEYIYVPVHKYGNWFLLVISLQKESIYYLSSNTDFDVANGHMSIIRTVMGALTSIFGNPTYASNFSFRNSNMNSWPYTPACGIPYNRNGRNSAVWVVEWMQMDCGFHHIFSGMLRENVIRMKTALTLCQFPFNELGGKIQVSARKFWAGIQGEGSG